MDSENDILNVKAVQPSGIPATGQTVMYKPQNLVISDKRELYRCYMPFIKGGGLFMNFNEEITPLKIAPGQKILIVLSILDNKERVPISGKVAWISRGGIYRGFGVSLGEAPNTKSIKEQIEHAILDFSLRKEPTYTF